MKLFKKMKDGGPESKVTGYFLIEWKSLFSIALLKFEDGSREAYHSHAFNCVSCVLRGFLLEDYLDGKGQPHASSFKPFVTRRSTFHKVTSVGTTWVLTFRGPWTKTWEEYLPSEDKFVTLTHGRKTC